MNNGLAMTRGLAKFDVARNDRLIDGGTKIASSLFLDSTGQQGATVVHGQQYALQGQGRIELLAHQLHDTEQAPYALQCIILALQWQEDGMRCGQGIDRQKPQGRRAVNQDVVVGLHPLYEDLLSALL